MAKLQLIIGLHNPGKQYENTRHNAGAWFINKLVSEKALSLKHDKKTLGHYGSLPDTECLLFLPDTYMNESGLPAQKIIHYFKIPLTSVLIIHDDLDLPAGQIKLKSGGGHGGHNGIRSLIQHLGTAEFHRLKIGIGHPGQKEQVHHYVLSAPSSNDKRLIDTAIETGLHALPDLLKGQWSKAMQLINTKEG